MRVLILKLSSMGDIVHTLPALSDAARAVPGIRFDWVAEEAYAQIPSWHPRVRRVIPVALRRWRTRLLQKTTYAECREFGRALRRTKYDCTIDAQGLLKSAVLSKMVDSPGCGMDYSSARESLAAFFYRHKFRVSKTLHAIERIRQLFALSLNYALPGGEPDYGIARTRGGSQGNYLVLVHGSARAEKKWPLPHWKKLVQIIGTHGYRVKLPWGNERELAEARMMASAHASAEVLPSMNLDSLRKVIQNATAMAACDTGLAHLGAALERPLTVMYSTTDPRLIGTRGRRAQRHLRARTLESISPEQVWQNLRPLLP